jgi:hypothetical protein
MGDYPQEQEPFQDTLSQLGVLRFGLLQDGNVSIFQCGFWSRSAKK